MGEVLLVIDKTVYDHYVQLMGNGNAAIQRIKRVYSTALNAVDWVFRTQLGIRIVPWEMKIITHDSQAPKKKYGIFYVQTKSKGWTPNGIVVKADGIYDVHGNLIRDPKAMNDGSIVDAERI